LHAFFRFISLSERPIIANIQGQEQQFNRIIFNFYAIQNLFAIQALYLNNSQLVVSEYEFLMMFN